MNWMVINPVKIEVWEWKWLGRKRLEHLKTDTSSASISEFDREFNRRWLTKKEVSEMITINMIERDPSSYIELDGEGRINYSSKLEKEFDGNLSLLLSCIGDYIFLEEGAKQINYEKSIAEYRKGG